MKLNTSITYVEYLLSNLDKNIDVLKFDEVNKETELKNLNIKYLEELTTIREKLSGAINKRDQLQKELDTLHEFEKWKESTNDKK